MDHLRWIVMVAALTFIGVQLWEIEGNTTNIGQAYACPAYGTELEL